MQAQSWVLGAVVFGALGNAFGVSATGQSPDHSQCPMHGAHSAGASGSETKSSYAGQENRAVKSLSQDEIDGYRAGRGMGLARPAELNHYPGPRHVLDMAEQLSLTNAQVKAAQAIYERMHSAAVPLGAAFVDAEAGLDAAFASSSIDTVALASLVKEASRLEGELRFVHLKAHVELRAVLTPEQVARYDALRGYRAH